MKALFFLFYFSYSETKRDNGQSIKKRKTDIDNPITDIHTELREFILRTSRRVEQQIDSCQQSNSVLVEIIASRFSLFLKSDSSFLFSSLFYIINIQKRPIRSHEKRNFSAEIP